MKIIRYRSDCPFSTSLDIFGDKWTLLVMRDIIYGDKHTYGDFLKMEEGIATNILADRLQTLETAGLLSREEHPGSKAKVYYRLTQMGIDLLPVMIEISIWAEKYFDIHPFPKGIVKEIKKDKAGFIKMMQARLKQNN